jgi:hypothetical protein
MLKRKIFFLFFLFIFSIQNLTGCKNKYELLGTYSVTEKTFKDRIFLNKMRSDGRIIGSEINLNRDSTFNYKTCGSIVNGIWSRNEDTLMLIVKNGKFISDSIQKVKGHELDCLIIKFEIRKNQLFRIWHFKDSTRSLELMTKID